MPKTSSQNGHFQVPIPLSRLSGVVPEGQHWITQSRGSPQQDADCKTKCRTAPAGYAFVKDRSPCAQSSRSSRRSAARNSQCRKIRPSPVKPQTKRWSQQGSHSKHASASAERAPAELAREPETFARETTAILPQSPLLTGLGSSSPTSRTKKGWHCPALGAG